MVHDRDPVAQHLGLVHVVRRQHDGAAGVVEPGEQVPEVAAGLRVERGGRLVEEDHLGVVHQRAGDREPLRLAAREVLDAGAGLVDQPDPLEPLVAAGGRHAVQRGERVDLLARGQPLEERRRLQLYADPRQQAGVARPRRLAQHRDGARVRLPEALDHLQGGGLAGTVRPEDPEELALGHLEAHPVDCPELPVGHREVRDLDSTHEGRTLAAGHQRPGPGRLDLRGQAEQRGLVVGAPDQLHGGGQAVGGRARTAPRRPGCRRRSRARRTRWRACEASAEPTVPLPSRIPTGGGRCAMVGVSSTSTESKTRLAFARDLLGLARAPSR